MAKTEAKTHTYQKAWERIGDDNKIVVRCKECEGMIVKTFWNWPTLEAMEGVRAEHEGGRG